MTDEVLFHHGTTTVRRLCLAPGESMPWHRDPFHRVAVVLSGDVLLIEYRDGGESLRVEISSGQVDWEEPSQRVHRATNIGQQTYVQVTVFLLDRPHATPQPSVELRSQRIDTFPLVKDSLIVKRPRLHAKYRGRGFERYGLLTTSDYNI